MKVVHVSASATGGAGLAAYRLHLAMEDIDEVDSYFVQKADTSNEQAANNTYTVPERHSIPYRILRKLRLTPEYVNQKRIPKFSNNYQYEIATFPTTSYRIEDFPLIKDADIIHLHWVADFLNYPTFFKKVKQPIVWTLHDKNPFHGLFHTETDEAANKSAYGNLDAQILKSKEEYIHQNNNIHIVTPSDWLKKKSENSQIFKQYPHYLIPNSIDLSKCNINRNEAKKELNVNNGLKTLFFIAHSIDIPRRGFFLLRDAIEKLGYTNFNLITLGGDRIDINSNINHIHYTTTHNETLINTIYSASDLMVLPTMEDNLPNVMLESFANGTPVLSFSNGGMAEHIKTGENGILIDNISVESLTAGLKDFLDNKYTFDEQLIRDYAKDHFSPKLQTDRYINLYKNILNK
ncbi:glycosyltransferase [Dysgonomonas sp. ZJ709]|uniref:glycosyltransferase n=1 Tax=Dysgonomonas sp. ZJ709 TaxID=2709797 RepID=UPI0013EAB990|nr:glycosyltransferase [Dysgonomonas sp. ZJ709]